MQQRSLGALVLALPLVVLASASADASVLFVRADAAPGGDGHAWGTAFNDLQTALGQAGPGSGVSEIWVAEGNYVPSPSDATASFVLINGVALYGGFAGTETSIAQRDVEGHPTLLNGDLGGDDIVGSGPGWYFTWNIQTANSGHIVQASGVDASAVLDGFVVVNGSTGPAGTSAGSDLMAGGGVYAVGGSPTIRHCTFRHCLAAFSAGGAVYLWNSHATVTECRFEENYGHLSDGAALFVGGASQPTIHDCLFRWNVIAADTPDAAGAAASMWSTQPVEIRRCDFIENLGKTFYAASQVPVYGGGLFNFNQPITVGECRFVGNTARLGGGFASFGASTIVNCLFLDNKAVTEFGGQGAAAWLWGNTGIDSTLVNCSAVGNDGKEYAVHGAFNGKVHVRNSILWANTATNPDLAGGYKVQVGGKFDAAYSCIDHIFDPPAPGEDPIEPANLPGCIQSNPLVAGTLDAHLQAGSPCVDRGRNSDVPAGTQLDLDGMLRFADDPQAPNGGVGSPPVDLGCYERASSPPCVPADLDCSGSVDAADLAVLLAAWGGAGAADLTHDGHVDAADLAVLLASWG